MRSRFPAYLVGVVLTWAVLSGNSAFGQTVPQRATPVRVPHHLYLHSLEWLAADANVVARGFIVDIDREPVKQQDEHWPLFNSAWDIVTLDVLETIKGEKVERLKFAVRLKTDSKTLGGWKYSKQEVLCFLKRAADGDREKTDRLKTDLCAGGNYNDACWMPVFALGPPADRAAQPVVFTMACQALKTPDDILKAARAAVAYQPEKKGPVGPCDLRLPRQMALRAEPKLCVPEFTLTVPRDERLEKMARRLIEAPADFLTKDDAGWADHFRLEGIKALRRFPSANNLALLRSWLDDPQPMVKHDGKDPREFLVPQPAHVGASPEALPADLAAVPEVFFQQPLPKKMSVEEAQLRTACTIDMIHFLSQKKTDGFMEALTSKRLDLAGLPFIMGDACRMKDDASGRFVAARQSINAALSNYRQKEAYPTTPHDGSAQELVRETYLVSFLKLESENENGLRATPSSRVAALTQMLAAEAKHCVSVVKYLDGMADFTATRALARLAIFSQEADARQAALRALRLRRDRDYSDILVAGLNYPWPQVAEWASEAIVRLGRTDLIPHLIDVLDRPDPRAPRAQDVGGNKATVVRELVRINHHHNCLLCHAPAPAGFDNLPREQAEKLAPLTAQVPVPSEAMNAYYSPNVPDILVRFDVTYLRQDFSLNLPVADADPWPDMQRYDFLVRTRAVSAQEAAARQELLRTSGSPYQRCVLSALRQLTGRDAGTTAAAWKKQLDDDA